MAKLERWAWSGLIALAICDDSDKTGKAPALTVADLGRPRLATNYVGVTTNATWTTINNGGYINIQQTPLYILRSGYFYSSSLDGAGVYGILWSSTASSSTRGYDLNFSSSYVYSAYSNVRYYGFPVRCKFDKAYKYFVALRSRQIKIIALGRTAVQKTHVNFRCSRGL